MEFSDRFRVVLPGGRLPVWRDSGPALERAGGHERDDRRSSPRSSLLAEAAAHLLTHAALDPIAKIPEYKVCAVAVDAVVRPRAPGAHAMRTVQCLTRFA